MKDPTTKRVLDKNEPWHMGHRPGFEFRKLQSWAADQRLTRTEFPDHYFTKGHFWPEDPGVSVGHGSEDMTDTFFGGG